MLALPARLCCWEGCEASEGSALPEEGLEIPFVLTSPQFPHHPFFCIPEGFSGTRDSRGYFHFIFIGQVYLGVAKQS